jgi:acyl-CoA synthetase (AMP-forming)/AMP-acid ligase II
MKRAVLCVDRPQDYIPQLDNYSIMILNPNATPVRNRYLLTNSDWSLLVTNTEEKYRDGADYPDERVLWYTSGTTGDSKFCSFSQLQLNHMAKTIVGAYDLTANDRYVSVMSLWHAHGQGFYWATQLAGCETNYVLAKDIRSMPNYSPTFITAIPDILRAIGKLEFDSNLRFIRAASSALPDKLYQALAERFQIPVIEAFGMTEAMSHCFTNPLHGKQRMGTVGLPSGIDACIDNGHLLIRGPTIFDGTWFDTGDLAEQDEAGYYRILGRSRDQINVRGSKLNPTSLERQLMESVAGLSECVIFGQDSVKCLYVGSCTPESIRNFLVGLGSQCWPKLIKQVNSIPLNNSGKISRSLLNEKYQ